MSHHLALFLTSLAGGGVERATLNLAGELARRGHRVELLLAREGGALRAQTPDGVRAVALPRASAVAARTAALRAWPEAWRELMRPALLPVAASGSLRALPGLADYLRRETPAALLAAKTWPGLTALFARRLAGVSTRVAVSERLMLSAQLRESRRRRRWRLRFLPPLLARVYPSADAILAVSDAVAEDLARQARLPRKLVDTVYNPVVPRDLDARASEPVSHPWLAPGAPPLLLAAGRLAPEKDQGSLLEAFARLRRERDARLVLLGDGPERAALERRAAQLGVAESVALPGFEANPYRWMARAAVFAQTSRFEGFGNALAEALASGCPIVATDCPGGTREILAGGAHGRLVPLGDVAGFARALGRTLDAGSSPEARLARRRSAQRFASDVVAERVCALMLGEAPR